MTWQSRTLGRFLAGVRKLGASVALGLAVALMALPSATQAADAEPAQVVTGFHDQLLEVMKQAAKLGFEGRYKRMEPMLDKTFDLGLMTRLAVGPQWSSLSPDQQKRATDLFRRLSITTYAARFDGYDPGQRFETKQASPIEGGDVTVESQLVQPKDKPVNLTYRMRNIGGTWRAIDVYLDNSVSELATRRSEFSGVLRSQGPDALLALLEKKISDLTPRS